MSQPAFKLSAYFPERQRAVTDDADGTRPTFLANQILELFDHHEIATSIMLRGISSFGPVGVLRSDESLTLSEDPPAIVYAVDTEAKITTLLDDVVAMTGRGLITLERAQLVRGGGVRDLSAVRDYASIKLSVYVGRMVRASGKPAYRTVCDILYQRGFAVASTLLGVDGTTQGARHRARFLSRNVNVPMMIVAVGNPQQVSDAVDEINAVVPNALVSIERVQLCKRKGELLARPHVLPPTDTQGRPLWQKLMVHTTEGDNHEGVPMHRQIVRRLLASGTAQGATAMRGVWGFRSERKPHGDNLFQLLRKVPMVTAVVGTPESIARSFDIVDEITSEHGVVTCEMVPAALSVHGPGRRGTLDPAVYTY